MAKKIRSKTIIFNFCFFALACAISLDLLVKGYPKKIFYIVSYITITSIILHPYKNLKILIANKQLMLFCGSLIVFSASKLLWVKLFKDTNFIDIRDNYHTVGKRFMLAAFIIFYFYECRRLLNKYVLQTSIFVIICGLIMALWAACVSYTDVEPRVKWTTDAATTGAYLSVFICMTSVILIHKCFQLSALSLLMFFGVILLSMIMVSWTGTRVAIFLVPVLYLIFFIRNYRYINTKIQVSFVAMIVIGAIMMVCTEWDRISQIHTNIVEYHINNSTSVGARLSMWKSGWYSSQCNFFGQSTDRRYQKVQKYIRQHERNNLEAIRNAAYHLHNDILEIFSLQGICGLFSLLSFYSFSLYFALHREDRFENSGILFIIWPLIIFGFTDVVLIQSNTALVVVITLALALPNLESSRQVALRCK